LSEKEDEFRSEKKDMIKMLIGMLIRRTKFQRKRGLRICSEIAEKGEEKKEEED